ncbi:hypothetical protein [Pandoraea apista]|uniref:hypothetical protein n=1 Tax=Pandoraea apista TaxID=93218 RepID=UPI000657954D|nr:hypothetical protein [Pandoraea apista]ALS63626.1 hypothetical protein AT395_00200 [Pandoraea apista]CFB63155.1 hypothetical protein LMG16407_03230 [Pandoraea apista]
MAVNWYVLSQSVIAAGAAVAKYAPTAKRQGVIHSAHAWNPTASAVTLNFYLVPTAGSAGAATQIWQVSVPAGKAILIPELANVKIPNPNALFVDGAGVTLTLTGAEADVA